MSAPFGAPHWLAAPVLQDLYGMKTPESMLINVAFIIRARSITYDGKDWTEVVLMPGETLFLDIPYSHVTRLLAVSAETELVTRGGPHATSPQAA